MVNEDHGITVPIVQEVASLSKRTVETGHVRVRTIVDEDEAILTAELAREDVVVERRAVEREVSALPPTRQDGDTLVISVVEERAVIEKRLFVVEEIVLRRVARTQPVSVPTTVRSMRAVVERDEI